MKKLIAVTALTAAAMLVLVACSSSGVKTGQAQENQQQRQATASMVTDQPLPHFNYSQIRQNMIELETAMANGAQSTSFFFNQGVVDPQDSCPSVGAPIPNTAQLSNPQQIVNENGNQVTGSGNSSGTESVVSQMDPIGVYTPASSTGTWVMCIDAQGRTYADYWEGFVRTVFAPAKWNHDAHRVELVGPPSFTFTAHKGG